MHQSASARFKILGIVWMFLLLGKQVESNVVRLGICPTIDPVARTTNPFATDPTAATPTMTKIWYEQRRYHSRFEHSLDCVTYTFTRVLNSGTSLTIAGTKQVTGRSYSITGTVTQKSTADFNRYSVTFNNPGFIPGLQVLDQTPTNYVVAASNTVNSPFWVVLFTCKQVGFLYVADSWVLTGTRFPPQGNVAAAIDAARTAGVPVDKYLVSDQTYCQ